MEQLIQRATSDWLTLRRIADSLAREATTPLLTTLNDHLMTRCKSDPVSTVGVRGHQVQRDPERGPVVRVFDLGAGSGANMAWLAPRLRLPQVWTLIDRDEDLLQLVPAVDPAAQIVSVDTQVRSINDLSGPEVKTAGLVTASAVLDVLSFRQLDRLAKLLSEAQVAALFSLNVTGKVHLTPQARPDDDDISEAFNCHQLRSGLAGPRAAGYLEQQLLQAGFRVSTAATPWLLSARAQHQDMTHQETDELIERYLTERVAAAVEQQPNLADRAPSWLTARLAQLRKGWLSVQVDHVDILALPPL